MHLNGLNCDRFLILIAVVLEGLLLGDELIGVGLLLLGVILRELVLFLIDFLLVLVETVRNECVGGRGGGGLRRRMDKGELHFLLRYEQLL